MNIAHPSRILTLALILSVGLLHTFASAQSAPPTGSDASVFVSGIRVTPSSSPYREKHRAERLAQELQSVPFAEVLLQVVEDGEAQYQSDLLPTGFGVAPGFDPLGSLIAELNKGPNQRDVIAVIDPIRVGNENSARLLDAKHVREAHPEWLLRDATGKQGDDAGTMYLDLAKPEVQKHIAAVAAEIAARYPVKGIMLTGVSDPETWEGWTTDQTSEAQQLRARHINDLITTVAQAVRQAKPGTLVIVDAEVRGEAPEALTQFHTTSVFTQCHQDWPAWIHEGLTDRLYLKLYCDEKKDALQFDAWMTLAMSVDGPTAVMIEVAGFENTSIDTYSQMSRVQQAGAAGLALATLAKPIFDDSARDMFFRAVRRHLLAEGTRVLQRDVPKLSYSSPVPAQPEQVTDATLEANLATPETEVSDDEIEAALATMEEVSAEDDAELPPPPAIESSQGVLLPVEPVQDEVATAAPARASHTDIPEEAETLALLNPDGSVIASSSNPETEEDPEAQRLRTREQLLSELLQDPILNQASSVKLLRPNERALIELKKTFPNIF